MVAVYNKYKKCNRKKQNMQQANKYRYLHNVLIS